MAEGCEESESKKKSKNRNPNNALASTMLGTVLPCETAITAALGGVSVGANESNGTTTANLIKREFVDNHVLGGNLTAMHFSLNTSRRISPTNSFISTSPVNHCLELAHQLQQQQHQQQQQKIQQQEQQRTPTPNLVSNNNTTGHINNNNNNNT